MAKKEITSQELQSLGGNIERLVVPVDGVYLVSRTTAWKDNTRPCEEAYKVETLDIDIRNCNNPRKIPSHKDMDDSWWYKNGTNHRVENGKICRDIGWSKKWAVKIDNLVDFIKKYGVCIVGIDVNNFLTLEISDDYH